MLKLEHGMRVQRNGVNTYFVAGADDKYALLECTEFNGPEDLGDGIMSTWPDQRTWIAQFHAYSYKEVK